MKKYYDEPEERDGHHIVREQLMPESRGWVDHKFNTAAGAQRYYETVTA